MTNRHYVTDFELFRFRKHILKKKKDYDILSLLRCDTLSNGKVQCLHSEGQNTQSSYILESKLDWNVSTV